MGKDIEFQFTKRTQHWAGGEARVFSVDSEAEFPSGRELVMVESYLPVDAFGHFRRLSSRRPTGP